LKNGTRILSVFLFAASGFQINVSTRRQFAG
jgi:hypothetical protein